MKNQKGGVGLFAVTMIVLAIIGFFAVLAWLIPG